MKNVVGKNFTLFFTLTFQEGVKKIFWQKLKIDSLKLCNSSMFFIFPIILET